MCDIRKGQDRNSENCQKEILGISPTLIFRRSGCPQAMHEYYQDLGAILLPVDNQRLISNLI
jgi:hypothetical protein